jgi:C1A family cysteine protease
VNNLPKVYDQKDNGDCVANAICYVVLQQTNNRFQPSRLFNYAISRILDRTSLNEDIGTTIQSATKALRKYGCCSENIFPYSIDVFTFPTIQAFQSSKQFSSFKSTTISQNINNIKSALQSFNTPIIFAILIFPSFLTPEVKKTGLVPLPNLKKEKSNGGHCLTMVGFNDNNSTFICANSWGSQWGLNGYCFIPYSYITNPDLVSDLMSIQLTF